MNLRGLITSLGAGGSLVAAALCALVVVGGILGVGGGKDGSTRAESGDIVMPGGAAGADDVARTPSARPAAPAADRPVATRRLPAERRTRSRAAPAPAPGDPVAAPAPDAPSPRASSPAAPAPSPPRAAAPPSEPVAEPVSVRGAVQRTRQAVAPVVDAAPAPVRRVVETADETVAPVIDLLP